MRVALDATYSIDPRPTGIAVYSRNLLSGLAQAYREDTFLSCYRPRRFLKARDPRLPLSKLWPLRADLFHALNQRVDWRPAKRVVTTFHDLFSLTSDFSSAEFRQRFSDFARQAAARSDLIIAVSRFTAGEVERLLGIPESRIRVVPHGVNLPASVSENREPIVLFTGAVQVRKNVARLARAFRALGPRWRLVIAGSPTGFGAEAILTELQALPGVDVRGYVSAEELKDLYRRASIFAFPSLGEGFGIPVLEAMAHGVPVITSKSTALEEIGNGAALLVNPASEDEIAHALTTLAANEDLRQSLIEAGLQRAREYPWQRTVAETYSVYRELF